MYVLIEFTSSEGDRDTSWYQAPTPNPQEATMMAMCFCSGYTQGARDAAECERSKMKACILRVQASKLTRYPS